MRRTFVRVMYVSRKNIAVTLREVVFPLNPDIPIFFILFHFSDPGKQKKNTSSFDDYRFLVSSSFQALKSLSKVDDGSLSSPPASKLGNLLEFLTSE